jgi:DNA-binding NtrC family response regulator
MIERDPPFPSTTVTEPREAPALEFRLVVIEGPDKGRAFAVDFSERSRVLVGTSRTCDVVLSDPHVSRRHLALEHSRDRLILSDLDSSNGTSIGGVSLGTAFLWGGETVALGGTQIRVDVDGESTAAPAGLERTSFGRLVGQSLAMKRLYGALERIAPQALPLIVEGEAGTGKELIAESLHEASPRAHAPFVVFDPTVHAPDRVEAVLFGLDGAPGAIHEARGGTLYVDEIAELGPAAQRQMVRFLERESKALDVRLIAATRTNLDGEVQAGRFREDLYFATMVGRVDVPPLRARRGDITVLAQHFWRAFGGAGSLEPTFLTRLEAYAWPGNVRELQNAVARRIHAGDDESELVPIGRVGDRGDHETLFARVLSMNLALPRARELVVDEFERAYIAHILERHGGNVTRAAAASGIARRYFQVLRARTHAPSKP